MDEQPVRLALLRKAFQSDWDGAAPSAPSSNGCAQWSGYGRRHAQRCISFGCSASYVIPRGVQTLSK